MDVTAPMTESREVERQVSVRVLRLRAGAQGLAFGTLAAIGVFVATNWLILKGGDRVGMHLTLLGNYFPGYQVTFVGSLIGACYAFAAGFVLGYIVAFMYNLVSKTRVPTSVE
jgi:hypothetical protein